MLSMEISECSTTSPADNGTPGLSPQDLQPAHTSLSYRIQSIESGCAVVEVHTGMAHLPPNTLYLLLLASDMLTGGHKNTKRA